METIFLFLLNDSFSFYEIQDNALSLIRINGEDITRFERNSINEKLQDAIADLCNEKNLENGSLSSFVLIENADPSLNQSFKAALGDKFRGNIPLDALLKPVLNTLLNQKPSPVIDPFGVNFDGKNYSLADGEIRKASFHLLGYTIQANMVIDLSQKAISSFVK
jgi:hypothetical protein